MGNVAAIKKKEETNPREGQVGKKQTQMQMVDSALEEQHKLPRSTPIH